MIDAKDLQIGSYVQDPNGTLLIVREIGLVAIVCATKYGNASGTNISYVDADYSIEDLRLIAITPEWLKKLDFTDISTDDGPEWGWQWNDDYYVFNYSITEVDEEYSLSCDTHFLAYLSGVHHLQALIWNLERVWLTLTTP